MNERPIILSGHEVRAILDGRQTQIRRAVKPQPVLSARSGFAWKGWHYGQGMDDRETASNFADCACPCGSAGDRLWVRETWAWAGDCELHELGLLNPDPFANRPSVPVYRADNPGAVDRWRPSIFMPRATCRLVLEVTEVRVERLQAITEADARAEGAGAWLPGHGPVTEEQLRSEHGLWSSVSYRLGFADLWDSINGDRPGCAWADDPWVWVVSFRGER